MSAVGRNPTSPIRVLLVDDSLTTLFSLKKILALAADIQVVGTATNGKEALEKIPLLQPDVICTDLQMPVVDGLELTRAVMEQFPRPILVLSVAVQKNQAATIFKLLEAGAIEIMAKPLRREGMEDGLDARELIRKIRILAGVVVIRKRRNGLPTAAAASGNGLSLSAAVVPQVIGIGASTGGPQAFREILTHLPANFPVPIICVQHISAEFMPGLVDWLSPQCRLTVKMAEPGVVPQPGTVYFPPGDAHLLVDDRGMLACSSTPIQDGHRPSISVIFSSLARYYGSGACGVLLTGMGRDGVEGMRAIAQVGGATISQDEQSSIVFGMPREAIAANAVRYVLPLTRIAPALLKLLAMNADNSVE
ncbi:chemotaxis-specific protein-glutamate methyltransferase CheB [Porticoccus sp.]